MKTFDELFREATEISDKRHKIFNLLIEKTKAEIIPAFAKMMEGYDIEKSFFTTSVKPFNIDSFDKDENGFDVWAFAIDKNAHVWECEKNWYTGTYTYTVNEGMTLESVEFRRSGIVNFVKLLNNRIEELNKKYTKNINEAEELLK